MPHERVPDRLFQPADALIEIQAGNNFAAARIGVFVLSGEDKEVRRFSRLIQTLFAVELLLRSACARFCRGDSLTRGLDAL